MEGTKNQKRYSLKTKIASILIVLVIAGLVLAYFKPASWSAFEPDGILYEVQEEFSYSQAPEWELVFVGVLWRQGWWVTISFEGEISDYEKFRESCNFTIPDSNKLNEKEWVEGCEIPELRSGRIRMAIDGSKCKLQIEKAGLKNVFIIPKLEKS